ncbi:MAG: DUF6941 family protein [Actinomycetota bacterium]
MPEQQPPPGLQGPHVAMAVICERVLQEQDGVLSIIRVIDRIIHSRSGPDVPTEMPPVEFNLTILVTLKSGAARGRRTIKIRPETPAGVQLQENELPILFEGEERGTNLIINVGLKAEYEGLYWFDVLLDDNTLLTRIPLRIIYQPQRTAGM